MSIAFLYVLYLCALLTQNDTNMKKIITMLCLIALITGCSKSPQDKAIMLLNAKSLSFGENIQLDSILGYPESFDLIIKAAIISADADSLLKQRVISLTELKNKGMNDEMNSLALRTRDEITNMANSALGYKQRAATIDLVKTAHTDPKEFLGWKFITKTDSCTYTVYFDKGVSHILGIAKQ